MVLCKNVVVSGSRAKSLAWSKLLSQGNSSIVVQNSEDFAKLANQLISATTILHISEDEITEFIKTFNPWENISVIHGIKSMHVIQVSPDQVVKSVWHTHNQFLLEFPPDILDCLPTYIEVPNKSQWCSTKYKYISDYNNCYVIVKLQTVAEREVFYLGYIMDINANGNLKIQYLRKKW